MRNRLLAISVSSLLLALGFSLWWVTRPQDPIPDPRLLTFQIVEFAVLKGWSEDDHAAALEPFLKSCGKLSTWPKDRALGGIGG